MTQQPPIESLVRAAIEELTDAAGPPPEYGVATASKLATPGVSHRMRVVAGACVIAVVVSGLIVIAQRRAEDQGTAKATFALWGTWELTTVNVGEEALTVSPGLLWTFQPDSSCAGEDAPCEEGPRLVGADGCNDFERSFTIDEATGQANWGSYWSTSAVLCGGPVVEAFNTFMFSPGFTASVEGSVATVRSVNSLSLVFERFAGSAVPTISVTP